jgi:hypothetical protein
MPILKAGVLYFVLVFGADFVLGTIRTLWIVPKLQTRMAELMETSIMLVITILAARWTAPSRSAVQAACLTLSTVGRCDWLAQEQSLIPPGSSLARNRLPCQAGNGVTDSK